MIILRDSSEIPNKQFGIYTYRPSCISDLLNITAGKYGEWCSYIVSKETCEVVSGWIKKKINPSIRPLFYLSDDDRMLLIEPRKGIFSSNLKTKDPYNWDFAWVEFSIFKGVVFRKVQH